MTIKIGRFDKTSAKELRRAIEQALVPVEAAYGITVGMGTIRFSPTEARTRMTMTVIPGSSTLAAPVKPDPYVLAFTAHAKGLGLAPSDLGRTFTEYGNTFKIVGARMSARKYPILCQRSDGRLYRFSASKVISRLGSGGKPPYPAPQPITSHKANVLARVTAAQAQPPKPTGPTCRICGVSPPTPFNDGVCSHPDCMKTFRKGVKS